MRAILKPKLENHLKNQMVIQESWNLYTEDEHRRWSILFKRQEHSLSLRAASEVLDGMKKLQICDYQIPKISEINKILMDASRFSVVPVSGLIPVELFFELLSQRKFPSTCFLRSPSQMDYLEEPDVFHDIFGHVPLLANPVFADLMESIGKKGLEAMNLNLTKYISALYWFTIEFGLIQTPKGLKIYGAGITSSPGESIFSVESADPIRFKFNPIRAMKTKYRIDRYQQGYFVIQDYNELFEAIRSLNWNILLPILNKLPDIEEGVIVHPDELL